LFRYYLDCLSQDDDSGIEVFADSRYDLDYIELEQWPLEGGQLDAGSEPLRKLIGQQKREARKKALWLGYPVLIRQVRSRNGWEGTFLAPLFVWPQDPDADELAFLPEPTVNTKALEGLTARENLLEEAAWLAEELGLDSPGEAPIDELAARLRELRPQWNWKEHPNPKSLRQVGALRSVSDTHRFIRVLRWDVKLRFLAIQEGSCLRGVSLSRSTPSPCVKMEHLSRECSF
jgi:hypothetical protein